MDPRHAPDRAELIRIWSDEISTIIDLVTPLTEQQWNAPTPCPGWSVGDLVAHLCDIEQMLAQESRPEHEPDWDRLPHATGQIGRFTEVGVDWRRGRSPRQVIEELRETRDRRRAQIDATPEGAEVMSPLGRPSTLERVLRMRILDSWVHEQDIRDATALPGGMTSDAAIVTLQQFLEGLPKVWAKQTGAPTGAVLHLVITDVGRGVEAWASVDDAGQGVACTPVDQPDVTVSLGWEDYLALSAGRVPPSVLRNRIHVEGDVALGDQLLQSMTITP